MGYKIVAIGVGLNSRKRGLTCQNLSFQLCVTRSFWNQSGEQLIYAMVWTIRAIC